MVLMTCCMGNIGASVIAATASGVAYLKDFCTCLKLFHICKCFGTLKIANHNYLNFSETLTAICGFVNVIFCSKRTG
jgi:hypothetical protein